MTGQIIRKRKWSAGKPVELSHTALMASYLMKSGWSLHLNNSREKSPVLWRAKHEGDDLTVESCDVSHDDVLELHENGILSENYVFEVGSETVTVFQYAD